jgi:tRNA modification GTPase
MKYKPGIIDTIVARATAPGKSAIAIIKLSGPKSFSLIDCFFRPAAKVAGEENRHAVYGYFELDGDIIDDCVILRFRGPGSYTGEDVVEINCHGSPYIVQQIVASLLEKGARMAEPGEFTQRAYLNGRMDLAQAEAVADLINSTNKAQHKLAGTQLRGAFSKRINGLRDQMIHFASMLELENDFGEEDLEFANRDELLKLLKNTVQYVDELIESFRYGHAVKQGIAVVIAGQPNAGKSTLLNALLGEDKALVSELAGTTRDYIEDRMILEGIEFRFIDTAGLRQTTDRLEHLGIERTKEQLTKAEIVFMVIPAHESLEVIQDQFDEFIRATGKECFLLMNKTDLINDQDLKNKLNALEQSGQYTAVIPISALKSHGLNDIKHALVQHIVGKDQQFDLVLSNVRHFGALRRARIELDKVRIGLKEGIPSDLVASDLRFAIHEIAGITGHIDTEDLLDKIFRDFCIGK